MKPSPSVCVAALGLVCVAAAPAAAGGSLKDGYYRHGHNGHGAHYAQPRARCCDAPPQVVYWERPVVYAVPVVRYEYYAAPVPYNRCCDGYRYGYAYTGYGCR